MAQSLPRLRNDLEAFPAQDRPGIVLLDPWHYSDAVLLIPRDLVQMLQFFDGEQNELDLRSALVRLTGDLQVADLAQSLTDNLSKAGFLEDETFFHKRDACRREFAEAGQRMPAHAGSAYPAEPGPLRDSMARYMEGAEPSSFDGALCGIAAPHVSLQGGWRSYRSAYAALAPEHRNRTFVILGTSHRGEPDRFGLTRKPYVTPSGAAVTDTSLVDWLEARGGPAVSMEDYCHSFEHTIEFQVIYLQHLYGPEVRILPVLCGQYAHSIYMGGMPEANEEVRRFLDALGELAAREGNRLMWVLGIDMAHKGVRYQERFAAIANQGPMERVAARDHVRIERVAAGDAEAYWALVQENHDDLNWCGSSPIYTFLRAVPQARGRLLLYEQWNIDPQSVVSFAGMAFTSH